MRELDAHYSVKQRSLNVVSQKAQETIDKIYHVRTIEKKKLRVGMSYSCSIEKCYDHSINWSGCYNMPAQRISIMLEFVSVTKNVIFVSQIDCEWPGFKDIYFCTFTIY